MAFLLSCERERVTFEEDEDLLERRDVAWLEEDAYRVLFFGRPTLAGRDDRLDAGALLRLYESAGRSFVVGLDGYFTVIIEDVRAGTVTIALDRFGLYHLFRARTDAALVFSDSVERLASVLPTLHVDRAGMVEFVYYGFFLGDRTHCEEVTKLPAATVLEIDGRLRERSHCYAEEFADAVGAPLGLEEIRTAFNDNVERCFAADEVVSLPLSGGLDSRAILSACLPHRDRLRCFTFGSGRRKADMRIAHRLCEAVGVRQTPYVLTGDFGAVMPGLWEPVMRHASGMINFMLNTHLEHCYRAEGAAAGVMLPGQEGELFRAFFAQHEPRDLDQVAVNARERMLVNHVPGLLRRGAELDPDDWSRRSVREAVGARGLTDPYAAAEACYRACRYANFHSYSVSLATRYMEPRSPFLSQALLQALPLVDGRAKADDMVQRYIISRNSPALAAVILDRGRVSEQSAGAGQAARHAGRQAEIAARKAANRVWKQATGRVRFASGMALDYAGLLARHQRELVERVLDHDSMVLAEMVDRETLARSTAALLRGSNAVCYPLTNLMCAELWLERLSRASRLTL